jgi:bifunctional DNase/RNase
MTDALIELKVMGIALDTRTGTPIVVLNDTDGRRALPIWIGTAEASAIIRHLEEIQSSRPMSHDLMLNLLKASGYRLDRVEIHDLNADTYYANLHLVPVDPPQGKGAKGRAIKAAPSAEATAEGLPPETTPAPSKAPTEAIIVDARPSDAIALALRCDAPIFATPVVMAEGTISTDHDRDEREAEAFKDFVSNLKASDFKFDKDIESDQ